MLGKSYAHEGYKGDLFSRDNPLWQQRGILAPGVGGKLKVISNRNAQQQMVATLAGS